MESILLTDQYKTSPAANPASTNVNTKGKIAKILACVIVFLPTVEGLTFETHQISNAMSVIKFSKSSRIFASQRYFKSSKLFFKNGKNLRQASELPV